MQIELVIATYQKPNYLRLVLSTLEQQSCMPDQVCVADDGSDGRTRAVLAEFPHLPLRHVWHEDLGFRKTTILNQAVRSSTADYMVFIDDDCLMTRDFIGRHAALAGRDRFASGSLIRLSPEISASLLTGKAMIWAKRFRPAAWKPGNLSDYLKSAPWPAPAMAALDALSPIRKSWAGSNAGTFRDNILKVNGFDEDMAYGGEDKEFGVRLNNAGIKGVTLRYSAPLFHLDHKRGYVDPVVQRKNRDKIASARQSGSVWAENGITRRV